MPTLSFHPAVNPTNGLLAPLDLDFSTAFTPQILQFFSKLGDLRRFRQIVLPGQSVAAVLLLPLLEMSIGLPNVVLYGVGDNREMVLKGTLSLGSYRHNEVRPQRGKLPLHYSTNPGYYTVLDGAGRGITTDQRQELSRHFACRFPKAAVQELKVVDVSMGHVDFANPTQGMANRLIDAGLNPLDVMHNRIVYLPPGNGLVAALQATTLHGLTEIWPQTARINRRTNGNFGVDEIVDPHALRQDGVRYGALWRAREAPVLVPRELFDRLIALCGDNPIAAELRMLTNG